MYFVGLRLLTECFVLVGYAMFGATFNLVTRVGLFLENRKNGCLKINSLLTNNCFIYRNILKNGVNTLSKMFFKRTRFLSKSSDFVHFGLYDLVQILPVCSQNTYQIMYGET